MSTFTLTTLIGRKLGKYEIVERLAQGGMAEVYRAHQTGVERSVVVKLLHYHLASTDSFVARFRREARAIGALQHPHIVRIFDFDSEGDLQYMVMDYIQGGTLADCLKSGERLPLVKALQLGAQLASALTYAHQQGVIHRDIKPGNILFSDASHNHAVLTDFGLAHLCDEESAHLTMTGTMIGTPTYMSPEAVRGEKCDGRSDIYSLGVVLYELLTGKPPYTANTPYSMLMKQANEELPLPRSLNPALPLAVEKMLLKALAKEPANRYQSAAELLDALYCLQLTNEHQADATQRLSAKAIRPQLSAKAPAQKPLPLPPSPRPTSRRNWIPLACAAGGVSLVAFMITQLMMRM